MHDTFFVLICFFFQNSQTMVHPTIRWSVALPLHGCELAVKFGEKNSHCFLSSLTGRCCSKRTATRKDNSARSLTCSATHTIRRRSVAHRAQGRRDERAAGQELPLQLVRPAVCRRQQHTPPVAVPRNTCNQFNNCKGILVLKTQSQ